VTKPADLSDIHGNHTALAAVLADIERQHADEVLVPGDMVTDFQQRTPNKQDKATALCHKQTRGCCCFVDYGLMQNTA